MKLFTLMVAFLFLSLSAVYAQPQPDKGNLLPGVTSTASLGGSTGSDLMSLGAMRSK
ncbi:MAG: hypothetical protein GX622_04555 [Bacteroidales bacterium]|nr:hypothetical protein [Bacteroidales bacterium]